MAIKQITKVWEHDLQPNEQLVLIAMADHANEDGTGMWPSNRLLAWKTGYSVRNIQNIKGRLRDKGILVKVKDATHDRPTEYRFDWGNADKKPPLNTDAEEGRKDFTPPEEGVNNSSSRGEGEFTSGVKASSPKPLVQPSDNRKNSAPAHEEGEEDDLPTRDSDPRGVEIWVDETGERPPLSLRQKLKQIFDPETGLPFKGSVFREVVQDTVLDMDDPRKARPSILKRQYERQLESRVQVTEDGKIKGPKQVRETNARGYPIKP